LQLENGDGAAIESFSMPRFDIDALYAPNISHLLTLVWILTVASGAC